VRRRIAELQAEGKEVKLFSIGRKGRDQLRLEYGSLMIDHVDGIGRRQVEYSEALSVADRLRALYDEGAFDVCTVVFNTFRSAMRQDLTFRQLIPVENPESSKDDDGGGVKAAYEFEPEEDEILAELLPRNLTVQVYGALVENAASEQGARMVAMDNATRNAGDMIKSLSLRYNRTRQAMITKELIEIVSGAEAL
jgi:F-type H+-transporting ATPase subunit gamma